MRRLKVVYREDARTDLQNIYNAVIWVSRNKTTAYRFYQRIVDRCERIGNVPHVRRPRDDLAPGLRTVPFEHSAVIADKIEDDLVRIVNIFYGGRDFESFYLGIPAEGDAIE